VIKLVKIRSKQGGLKIQSTNPYFEYVFESETTTIDVPEEHAAKILANTTFYKVEDNSEEDKKKKNKKGER